MLRCFPYSSIKKHISFISSYVSPKKVWDRTNKSIGYSSAFKIFHFIVDGDSTQDVQACRLRLHFEVSSSTQSTQIFICRNCCSEMSINSVSGGLRKKYNSTLFFVEPRYPLHICKFSVPCPGNIHYLMIRGMHPSILELILSLFNQILMEGHFPTPWRTGIALALLKPGGAANCPTNQLPIYSVSSL